MKRVLISGLCGAALAGLAVSCGDSDVIFLVNGEADTLAITVIDESSIVVETLFLQVGDTAELEAAALNALGQPFAQIDPDWYSTAPDVASVSDDGVVAALRTGSTDIVATYQDASARVPTIVTAATDGPAPQPPIATIVSPGRDTTITPGEGIEFRGSASHPEGRAIATHRWTFGDGGTASVMNPGVYIYTSAGSYAVRYQVTDDLGVSSAFAGRTVVVNASVPPPPPRRRLRAVCPRN